MSKHDREKFDLEGELGAARPRAPRRFIDTVAARAGATRSGIRGARPAIVALIGIGSLAVAGGIGFAASTAIESSSVAVKRVAADGARTIAVRNAAADAYQDNPATAPVVDPPGRPVVTAEPPVAVQNTARQEYDIRLSSSITVNSSGVLSISVDGANGRDALILGGRTTVDGLAVGSGTAEVYRYRIQTPRTLAVVVTLPYTQVRAGERLTVNLSYTDDSRLNTKVTTTTTAPATIATPPAGQPQRFLLAINQSLIKQLRAELARDKSALVTVRAADTRNRALTVTWAGQTRRSATGGPLTLTKRLESERDLDLSVDILAFGYTVSGTVTN